MCPYETAPRMKQIMDNLTMLNKALELAYQSNHFCRRFILISAVKAERSGV